MSIIEIVILAIGILLAIAQGINIREKARNEQSTEHTFETHAFLLAVSVIIIPALGLSPFHLLWMMPAAFVLGIASITFPLKLLWLPASLYGSLWYVGTRNPALALYRNGDYNESIEAFRKAIQKKPNSRENQFYLAMAYDKIGNHDKAIEHFKECIRLKPDDEKVYCNLGLTYKDSGDLTNAKESFSKSIQMKPDYAKGIWHLGMTYIELQDFDKAMEQHTALQAVDKVNADKLYSEIITAKG